MTFPRFNLVWYKSINVGDPIWIEFTKVEEVKKTYLPTITRGNMFRIF